MHTLLFRSNFVRGLLSLLAIALLTSPIPSAKAQNRLAFVAGIDKYEKIGTLSKAVNDAKGVAKALDNLGYKVSLSPELGRLDFKGKWEAFLRSVNPGDEVVFYFAGHGIELQGVNYLLPKDTPEIAHGEDILRVWGLSFKELKAQLDERRPKLTIYILDACRDNPFKGKRGGERTGVAIEKVEGAFILYSAGEYQQALDWLWEEDPDPNSVFTRRLLPLFAKQGLQLNQLAEQVASEVEHDALNNFKPKGMHEPHRQRPTYYNGLNGVFCFAGCDAQEAAKTLTSLKSEAADAWRRISDTKTPDALIAFIRRYKGDFYADLALGRLEELITGKTAAVSTTAAARRSGRPRHAFVAAVGDYRHLPQLANTVSDARSIVEPLSRIGFTTQLATDLTRLDFLANWDRFLKRVDPGDDAVFFFMGHGLELSGEAYIIPADAKLASEKDTDELISLTFLLNSLRDARPNASIAFLDTCRDNPFAATKKSARGFTSSGLTVVDNPIGSFVMYAAGAGECSLDGDAGKGGPFINSLLRHMETPNLDVTELAKTVRWEVFQHAQSIGHRQTPAYYDSLVGKFCMAGAC